MREEVGCVVEEVECKVEDAAREWAVIDTDPCLVQVPSSRAIGWESCYNLAGNFCTQ